MLFCAQAADIPEHEFGPRTAEKETSPSKESCNDESDYKVLIEAKASRAVVERVGEHCGFTRADFFPQALQTRAAQWPNSEGEYLFIRCFHVTHQEFKPLFDCWDTDWRAWVSAEICIPNQTAFRRHTEKDNRRFDGAATSIVCIHTRSETEINCVHSADEVTATINARKGKGGWNDQGNQREYNNKRIPLKYAHSWHIPDTINVLWFTS